MQPRCHQLTAPPHRFPPHQMIAHNMPLNFLIDQLRENTEEVIFLGVQPDVVMFYFPM